MPHLVNKTILDNGVRILTKKMAHVRSVSMGVWVIAGARDESKTQSGLSHFIEHMIFKGTQRRNAFQIAKAFDAIGGNTNAFTSMEVTCYHGKVMDIHLNTMVDILTDIFLNSIFDPGEVEKERPVILQEIGMVEDSPEDHVHTLMSQNFWGKNPLGRSILGSKENIIKFDADHIKDFFKRFYQPDRIIISLAGSLEHDQIVDLIAPLFESIPQGMRLPERVTPEIHPHINLNYRELEQVHVCIATKGLKTTDPGRYAMSLANTIMGGNMSSRLFQEIRERRGLAYNVCSFNSSHDDTGMFGTYAGVAPDKVLEVVDLIIKEMRNLKTSPVDEMELRDAIEYTKGSLFLSSENSDNQMVRLAQNEIHFDRYIPLQKIVDNIEKVTVQGIKELLSELFKNETLGLTALGPLRDDAQLQNILQL